MQGIFRLFTSRNIGHESKRPGQATSTVIDGGGMKFGDHYPSVLMP